MLLGMLIVGGPYALLIAGGLFVNANEKRYMAAQRSTGRDKQRMLDFMQIVMKEYYGDYTMWQGATGYRQADIRRTIIHILWALTRKIWSLFLILHGMAH